MEMGKAVDTSNLSDPPSAGAAALMEALAGLSACSRGIIHGRRTNQWTCARADRVAVEDSGAGARRDHLADDAEPAPQGAAL